MHLVVLTTSNRQVMFQEKRESIFEYYVNNGFENFLDHKFHENLKNSKDIVSFIVKYL